MDYQRPRPSWWSHQHPSWSRPSWSTIETVRLDFQPAQKPSEVMSGVGVQNLLLSCRGLPVSTVSYVLEQKAKSSRYLYIGKGRHFREEWLFVCEPFAEYLIERSRYRYLHRATWDSEKEKVVEYIHSARSCVFPGPEKSIEIEVWSWQCGHPSRSWYGDPVFPPSTKS